MSLAEYPWLRPGAKHRYGDLASISRNYLPADYLADVRPQRVVGTVFIEAHRAHSHDPVDETRWVAGVRARSGCPSVCIAAAYLERDDAAAVLAAHAAFGFVRGIRNTPSRIVREPGARTAILDPRWRAGFGHLARHGMSCDLIVPWWHLAETAALAREFPGTTIIVNHAAYPPGDRNSADMASWRAALEQTAREPNIALKISGLGRPGGSWRVESDAGLVRDAIRIFGEDRCMFASNFPVERVLGSFDALFRGLASIVSGMPAASQKKLFCDNARRIYRI